MSLISSLAEGSATVIPVLPVASVFIAWVRRLIGRVMVNTTRPIATRCWRGCRRSWPDQQVEPVLVEVGNVVREIVLNIVVRRAERGDFLVERGAVAAIGVVRLRLSCATPPDTPPWCSRSRWTSSVRETDELVRPARSHDPSPPCPPAGSGWSPMRLAITRRFSWHDQRRVLFGTPRGRATCGDAARIHDHGVDHPIDALGQPPLRCPVDLSRTMARCTAGSW